MADSPFSATVVPNWRGLRDCIMRRGTPDRVYFAELFLDLEVREDICRTYHVLDGLDSSDAWFDEKAQIRLQRFLGYDYVRCSVEVAPMPTARIQVEDTATIKREGGRSYLEEHRGPITNWEEFEAYPWPDVDEVTTRSLEWYQEHLPDDMCIINSNFGHCAEFLNWLMGYETLSYALYDQRDLVSAIAERVKELYRAILERYLAFDRVKFIWSSDDMGFRTGTLISPGHLREFALPTHKLLADMSHAAGRPYLLHSCGNLSAIMEDLISDVGIDAKHSFEDTIETVGEAKALYGDRIALLGGIDIDFLCRATEEQVRSRVRDTLEQCIDGGGYCLGTGNSVANYLPVSNYLAMLDAGRAFSRSMV